MQFGVGPAPGPTARAPGATDSLPSVSCLRRERVKAYDPSASRAPAQNATAAASGSPAVTSSAQASSAPVKP